MIGDGDGEDQNYKVARTTSNLEYNHSGGSIVRMRHTNEQSLSVCTYAVSSTRCVRNRLHMLRLSLSCAEAACIEGLSRTVTQLHAITFYSRSNQPFRRRSRNHEAPQNCTADFFDGQRSLKIANQYEGIKVYSQGGSNRRRSCPALSYAIVAPGKSSDLTLLPSASPKL